MANECKHPVLMTVGDRVFCAVCQKELDLDFLLAKNRPQQSEKEAGKGKAPAKKKAAKTAE